MSKLQHYLMVKLTRIFTTGREIVLQISWLWIVSYMNMQSNWKREGPTERKGVKTNIITEIYVL